MTEWEDIELVGRPEFLQIDPHASDLNIYTWKLSRLPEQAWVARFKAESSLSTLHPLTIAGAKLRLTPPEGQLQAYANQVRTWVRDANAKFRSFDLPQLEARTQAAQRQEQEHDDRIRHAREEAENLDLRDG